VFWQLLQVPGQSSAMAAVWQDFPKTPHTDDLSAQFLLAVVDISSWSVSSLELQTLQVLAHLSLTSCVSHIDFKAMQKTDESAQAPVLEPLPSLSCVLVIVINVGEIAGV